MLIEKQKALFGWALVQTGCLIGPGFSSKNKNNKKCQTSKFFAKVVKSSEKCDCKSYFF